MLLAYDSANPPNRQTIKAQGGIGGARYIKKNLPNSYDLGSTERLGWLADGLGLLYNAEQSANDALVQGQKYFADYGKYVADRLLAFGVNPTGVNVAVSVDCPVTTSELSTVMSNLDAFAASCDPFGMVGYAQLNVLNLLTLEGISPKGAKHWLPGSIAWSGLPNTKAGWAEYLQFPYAGMVQLGPQAVGFYQAPTVAGCDTNLLLDPLAMGFEWPTNSPYFPKKPTIGDDMPLLLLRVDPNTVPSSQTGVPQGIYTNEGGLHWLTDLESEGDIANGLSSVFSTDGKTVTAYLPISSSTTVAWGEIRVRAMEKYGPGGIGLFPTGTDFGAGVGTPNGDGTSWVPMPGTAPQIVVNVPPITVAAPPAATYILNVTGTATPEASA